MSKMSTNKNNHQINYIFRKSATVKRIEASETSAKEVEKWIKDIRYNIQIKVKFVS